jgi:hypothetical protein
MTMHYDLSEPYAPLRLVQGARGEIELGATMFRRFLDVEQGEPVELVALPQQRGGLRVAYPRTLEETVRLMREGERLPGASGVYIVPNKIDPIIAERYPAGQWSVTTKERGRAKAENVTARRALYVDLDAVRPDKAWSATDEEKRPCYDVADRVQEFLERAVGDLSPIGRGDSGNGLAIFVALQPTPVTEATTGRLSRLLEHLARKFNTKHVDIDVKVFDPPRLCPAFGSLKTKRSNAERPNRRTYFSCRGWVRRVPLEALV